MRLTTHADAHSFLAVAEPLLAADEPRHNLAYAIAGRLRDAPDSYPDFRLWTVDDADTLAALVWTPPWNIVVAQPRDPGALDFAAAELVHAGVRPPGVVGAVPEVHAFAHAWEREANVRARVRMSQGIYAARRTRIPEDVVGEMRFATATDRELLLRWIRDFRDEALPGDAPGQGIAELVDRRIASEAEGFAFWDVDGTPAAVSGYGGPTPNGIRIGPVYTPPERRRRGYAGALVARLTQHLLDAGREFCFLYTDLANPTSNHVYTDVGYEFVCESVDYAFDAPLT